MNKLRFIKPIKFQVVTIHGYDLQVRGGIKEYLESRNFKFHIDYEMPFQRVQVYLSRYKQYITVHKDFVVVVDKT